MRSVGLLALLPHKALALVRKRPLTLNCRVKFIQASHNPEETPPHHHNIINNNLHNIDRQIHNNYLANKAIHKPQRRKPP